MSKEQKLFKKQEKRIISLLYHTGLLTNEFGFKLKELYWNAYKQGKKVNRTKHKYKYRQYFEEIHYWTSDYYGEGDEHGLVDHILDCYWWKYAAYDSEEAADSGEWPTSTWKHRSRKSFIKYLSKLPKDPEFRSSRPLKKLLKSAKEY